MKRVLIISNNCFSNTNSNGRTLGNLLCLYEKDKIAQFYISGIPEESFCTNYFQVSDNDVLSSLFPFKRRNKKNKTSIAVKKRTVKNMILRNVAWDLGWWKTTEYNRWLDSVSPEVVILQVGDCSFMINIAMQIAKKYNASLIVYNSESYYFKAFNYFRDGSRLLYNIFISNYKFQYNRLVKRADSFVYLTEDLMELYKTVFDVKSYTIYNSSSMHSAEPEKNNGSLVISYFGNLELGRDKTICSIAKVLSNHHSSAMIHVYGNASNEARVMFSKENNIVFHGFITYSEVIEAIKNSNVLLHVESFDEFYIKDTQYGFSGKIADCLCSGRALLVYAPKSVSCVKYLRKHRVGFTASNTSELNDVLKSIFSYENRRKMALKQLELGKKNHDLYKNSRRFIEIIG